MMNGRSSFPFTLSQWQELEHQALIYKYMVSGIPIPPDLLLTIKRSYLDSALPSKLFSHHPQYVGWNCFQMGLGRKIDPEPGRCRRTDGKKWRCSKEAFPDSKYCERHMHRGKNRSRKPVEVLKTSTATNNSNTSFTPNISSITMNNSSSQSFSSFPSMSSEAQNRNLHPVQNTHLSHLNHPSVYQHTSSSGTSSRPPGLGLSSQDSNTSLPLESGSYFQNNSDYCRNQYVYGLKEEVGEHPFFSQEPSGTIRGSSSMEDSWQLTPLTMSSCSSSLKQRTCLGLQIDQSYLQLQSFKHQKQDHSGKQETQKTIHHFFDEWPKKERDLLFDLDDKSSHSGSVSTTQLSISIPTSSYDFPIFNSRTHNGD
ncbi:hypothetical protein UlMin_021965 [Ulmus minor]